MATIIRIKRSGTSGNPTTLAAGELAYSYLPGTISNGGDRLYIGTGTETNGDAANHEVIGGKYFTSKLNHAPGTLTANAAIITDSSSSIDVLKVDNIKLDSSTVATLNGSALKLNQVLDLQGDKIINLGTPTAATDAATKAYVDGVIGGDAIQLQFSGDGGTGDITLSDSSFAITGSNGITTTASGAGISIALDNSISITDATIGDWVFHGNRAYAADSAALKVDNVLEVYSGVTKAAGDSATNVFSVLSSTGENLFEVRENGDAVIGGVLTVEGTGTTTFTGDVDIGGALTVQNGASVNADLTGNNLTLTGNLTVNGNTTLGDSANNDTISFGGRVDTAIVPTTNNTYDLGSSSLEWKDLYVDGVGNIDTVVSDKVTAGNWNFHGNRAYATDSAALDIDHVVTVHSSVAKAAGDSATNVFSILDVNDTALFEVRENGDTVIGGTITVNGTGQSTFAGNTSFAGDVDIGGSLTVAGDATLNAEIASDDLTLTGNLVVKGNTTLGDSATNDTITVGGRFGSALVPATDDTHDLGSATHEWKDLYVDGVAYIDEISADIANIDNIRIDGNKISTTDGSNQLFIDPAPTDSAGGDLIVQGNLIVQGTTTTISSTEVSIGDKTLNLADSADNNAEADGAGITVGSSSYTGTAAAITYDGATDTWDFNKPVNVEFATLDSAVQLNGVGLGEVIHDEMSSFLVEGEGIDITYNDPAGQLTIAAELATTSNPGVANFDSDQMTVTSGLVSIVELDGGTF